MVGFMHRVDGQSSKTRVSSNEMLRKQSNKNNMARSP